MKLKDKAVTCFHCGAWEVVTTDWLTSRLIVEASRACTCSEVKPLSELPTKYTATCMDCGDPCRENARRCPGCKNARDKHMRATYWERKSGKVA